MSAPQGLPLPAKRLDDGRLAYVGTAFAMRLHGVPVIIVAADQVAAERLWDALNYPVEDNPLDLAKVRAVEVRERTA